MNNFMQSLQQKTTKQIDEKIYGRLVKALRRNRENYTEQEEKQIERRCLSFQEIFVNFDRNLYELERYKEFIPMKATIKSETREIDMEISRIIKAELEEMYKEVLTPKEKIQVLDRMINLISMFQNFDNEMLIIQKNNTINEREKILQEL